MAKNKVKIEVFGQEQDVFYRISDQREAEKLSVSCATLVLLTR